MRCGCPSGLTLEVHSITAGVQNILRSWPVKLEILGLERKTDVADPKPVNEQALDQSLRRYRQRKLLVAVLLMFVAAVLAGCVIVMLIQSGRLSVPIAHLPPALAPATGDMTPRLASAEIVATNSVPTIATVQPTFTPATGAAQSQATATALPADTAIPPTQTRPSARAAPSPTPLPLSTA